VSMLGSGRRCSQSRPGKSPKFQFIVFVAALVVQAQFPRTRAPLRPSGGRGRGPRSGKVRWVAPQTGSSAPLTLPSPPGQRGERGKGARRRSHASAANLRTPVVTLSPDSLAACGERVGVRGLSEVAQLGDAPLPLTPNPRAHAQIPNFCCDFNIYCLAYGFACYIIATHRGAREGRFWL
jgi:hypothetical protein